jgi:hypothetical protein
MPSATQPAAPPDRVLPGPAFDRVMPSPEVLSKGPVEVLMNPEEMGRLRFALETQGDAIRVVLTAERPETLDLMRRHADQLLVELKAAGFQSATLDFGQWQQQDARPGSPGLAQTPDKAGAAEPPDSAAHSPFLPRSTRGGGLDLRL